MRIKKDTLFMKIAELVAQRSTCLRRKVGCVLVKEGHIIATGFNGAPAGISHCKKCLREKMHVNSGERHELCISTHAEMNAIIQCALYQNSPEDSVLYTTNSPCSMCTKILLNAKIFKVIYKEKYADDLAFKLAKEANLIMKKINGEEK